MDESKPNQSPDKGVKEPSVSETETQTNTKETHELRDDIDVDTPISDIKGPNVFERVKEEFEALAESIQSRRDKSQDSPSSAERGDTTFLMPGSPRKLKLKNLRIKSESQKSPVHHKETHGRGKDIDPDTPISEFKGPSIFHRAKEEIEAIVDTINTKKESSSPRKEGGIKASFSKLKSPAAHYKETHGRGEDIDPNTPISEFRGPSIFHRAKEEIEAIVDTINQKKDSESPKKEGGFRASISKKLQRAYSGKDRNRD